MKKRIDFVTAFPLKQKVVRDLKIITDHLSDIKISGVAYFNPHASKLLLDERYAVDIENIEGNILDVLNCGVSIEEIYDYCYRYAATLFENEESKVA
jgi:hypothetical protein